MEQTRFKEAEAPTKNNLTRYLILTLAFCTIMIVSKPFNFFIHILPSHTDEALVGPSSLPAIVGGLAIGSCGAVLSGQPSCPLKCAPGFALDCHWQASCSPVGAAVCAEDFMQMTNRPCVTSVPETGEELQCCACKSVLQLRGGSGDPSEFKKMQTITDSENVLQYWFPNGYNSISPQLWFGFQAETDEEVRSKFGRILLQSLSRDGLSDWTLSMGWQVFLARIVVLDQFYRMVFRGTPAAFFADKEALALTKELIAEPEVLSQIPPVGQIFALMPLQHSENMADQDLVVDFLQDLSQREPDHSPLKSYLEQSLNFAVDHRKVIQQFGRFPHRNQILSRPNTQEENNYLNSEDKQSWGQ